MDAIVSARDVSRAFDGIQAVRDVSLEVPRGLIFGLLGPSGSGKTTLMRLFAGALRPTSGEVRVFGRPMPDRTAARRIGYMTQAAALYPDLSLRENLLFFGEIYGLDRERLRRRIAEVAEEVELIDRLDSPLHTFSGGMRQRASLACALLHQPDLLILDEPTVGLDPVLRRTFWARFRRLADAGTTLVVSSHIMDEADRCDVLAFLRDGRLFASDTPDALRRATGYDDLEDAFLALAGETQALSEAGGAQ